MRLITEARYNCDIGCSLPSDMLLSTILRKRRKRKNSHYAQSPEGDKPPLVFVVCD